MKLRAPKHAKPGEVAASLDELAAHSGGLICLTGGDDGPLAHALETGGMDEAITTAEKLAWIFGRATSMPSFNDISIVKKNRAIKR